MSWNDVVIEQFHEGRERIADTFDRGVLLLLHTVGAKSGEPRVSPLAYQDQGDSLVIIASAAGADRHPAWYHNLLAIPQASIERWHDGALQTLQVRARVTEGEERERLWAQTIAWSPGFAEYQTKTDRLIPVVVLDVAG